MLSCDLFQLLKGKVKVNVIPVQAAMAYGGVEVGLQFHSFLTSSLDGDGHLYHGGKRPRYPLTTRLGVQQNGTGRFGD
jgi:hypothetical protein